MNKKDAKTIKKFRQHSTWRTVARLAAEKWPEHNYCSGNQVEGMELCKKAAKILNENPWKPPWN